MKISRGSSKRAIFIEGGQVAADWLSPTVVTYIVDQLVKGDNSVIREATEEFEWHIFPILNPDGHEFTQNSVSIRNTNYIFSTNPNLWKYFFFQFFYRIDFGLKIEDLSLVLMLVLI